MSMHIWALGNTLPSRRVSVHEDQICRQDCKKMSSEAVNLLILRTTAYLFFFSLLAVYFFSPDLRLG